MAQTASAPKAKGGATPAHTNSDAKYRAFVNQYCIACHSKRAANPAEAPVNLEAAGFDDLLGHAETWERVLRKLSVRAMPPPGVPRPPEGEYAAFTSWLAASLDRAWEGHSTPGRYVVHRLNRAEYANAVRDLLAVDIDVSDLLPTDGAEFGFDNIATALKTSPLLLEGYVNAAERVSAMAVGDPQVRPGTTEHSISREFSQNGYIAGLPLGTVGGTVVHHVFPADAEYKLSGRLVRGVQEGYAGVEGNDTPYTFVITIDGAEVYSAPVGGPADDEMQAKDLAAAQPVIDKRMTGRVRVTAGPHDVGFTWRERPAQLQDVWEPSPARQPGSSHGRRPAEAEDRVHRWSLQRARPERRAQPAAALCLPSRRERQPPCRQNALRVRLRMRTPARRRSSPISRAGRIDARSLQPTSRPRSRSTSETRQSGGSFDDGIRAGVARVLSSPYFLYRIESDPPGARAGVAHPVSDVDLASRLSFFLWSSVPDEKLLDLAAAGRLREPEVLSAQVHRMLADDRSDALVDNFTGQWLQLRNLESKVVPDILMFPDFDDNIRKGFRTETEMFFGYILRENRSALELLNADYTFVDERLARHYGIKGVYGPQFRKVKLTDPNRRGLLGQGSILAMTSVATRTSPVYRGKYVLSTFLNTPPPPPPPNVPTLGRKQQGLENSQDGACATGIAPQEPALCGLPSRDRSGRALRSRTSIRWEYGAIKEPMARRWTSRARSPMEPRSTVRWRCGRPF